MENGLLKKLYFKPGFKVLLANAPENVTTILGDTTGITLVDETAQNYDGLLLFVKNSSALSSELKTWGNKINDKLVVWIAYPKKSAGITTDLKMEKWQELDLYKLSPCGSASIDDTWTGLRIKPADKIKTSGVGNTQIKNNEFAGFIDVERKKVTVPPDLAKLFLQHPHAQSFFQSLAYSHQKEYVLWILTAKQEQTRNNRLLKTIEILLAGKKNPTAK
jgi:hypothetical protein